MNQELFQISVDLWLISRLCIGFIWGATWAAFIQFNRQGQFLVRRRTWITVVIGIGIDLLIAYQADWNTTTLVIGMSAIGIIFRSLWNESQDHELNDNSYKLKWALMDGIALADKVVSSLTRLLADEPLSQPVMVQVSKTLAVAHQIKLLLKEARKGEYEQKNSK